MDCFCHCKMQCALFYIILVFSAICNICQALVVCLFFLQVDLKNWMVVFTQRNGNQARDFIRMMETVCPNMGIAINQPTIQELQNDRTETYLRAIRDNINPKVRNLVLSTFLVL